MRQFLKRLFGSTSEPTKPSDSLREPARPRPANATGGRVTSAPSGEAAVNRYFELLADIQRAKASGDFLAAIRAARETYPLFPAVVRMNRHDGPDDQRCAL